MEENQRYISHFGVPGMKWGRRMATRYEKKAGKALAKAEKLEGKGNKEAAQRKREAAEIYKKRGVNAKEVAKIGERIRKGSSLADKILGTDVNLMSMKLSKGKYTSGELAVSNILQGSRYTMDVLVSERVVNG